MTDGVNNCVKCGGGMVRGFVSDRMPGNTFQARWTDGEVVKSKFLGIDTDAVKVDDYEALRISGYRCTVCGFLELYTV